MKQLRNMICNEKSLFSYRRNSIQISLKNREFLNVKKNRTINVNKQFNSEEKFVIYTETVKKKRSLSKLYIYINQIRMPATELQQ